MGTCSLARPALLTGGRRLYLSSPAASASSPAGAAWEATLTSYRCGTEGQSSYFRAMDQGLSLCTPRAAVVSQAPPAHERMSYTAPGPCNPLLRWQHQLLECLRYGLIPHALGWCGQGHWMGHGCGTHESCDSAVARASGGHLDPGHMLSRTGWQLGCPGHSRALPVTSGSAPTPGLHGDMVSVKTVRLSKSNQH